NVMFATWSEQGGQDDLVWYTGHKNADGNWETTIDIRDHKTAGAYKVDVYYTLANGVMKGFGSTFFEVSSPSMTTSIENYDEEKGTFEVVVSDIVSPSGVDRVQVPVWCASDQSDIRWYDAEKQNDGSYKAKISTANHNFATGTYQVHVYVTTKNGLTQGVVAGTQNVSLPDMEIIAEDTTGEEMTYKVQATNVGLLGVVKNVMFATWSEQGGQDDLVWYTGHKNADGNWE
ncbi:GBS Bsp-like repeat-containing protein, partial [Eubacterium sp. ER2]